MKWQDVSVEIKICPLLAVCPYPGAIYMYKIMKTKGFFWNLQQKTEVTRCSYWHHNFIPKGLWGYIHV